MTERRGKQQQFAYQKVVPSFLQDMYRRTGYQGDEATLRELKRQRGEPISDNDDDDPEALDIAAAMKDDQPVVVVLDEKKHLSVDEAQRLVKSGKATVGAKADQTIFQSKFQSSNYTRLLIIFNDRINIFRKGFYDR